MPRGAAGGTKFGVGNVTPQMHVRGTMQPARTHGSRGHGHHTRIPDDAVNSTAQMIGFNQDAFATYTAALALQPRHAGALTALGHLFQKEGMLAEAVEARKPGRTQRRRNARLLLIAPRRWSNSLQSHRNTPLSYHQQIASAPLPTVVSPRAFLS